MSVERGETVELNKENLALGLTEDCTELKFQILCRTRVGIDKVATFSGNQVPFPGNQTMAWSGGTEMCVRLMRIK